MGRPTMDRERLAGLAEGWEPTQRFTRDDINACLEMIDARDEHIRELEGEVERVTKARATADRLHGQCDERIRGLEADIARAHAETVKVSDIAVRMRRVNGVISNLISSLP
jgi:cell division septum initiation protein DivIVA